MFAVECVMALTLLASPKGSLDYQQQPGNYQSLLPTLRQMAVKMEILDRRELRYVLTRSDDYKSDLKLLRRRYRNLQDAPPLDDCIRFPQRAAVNDLLTFNRTYRQYLIGRQSVELVHTSELRMAVKETDRLYEIWDSVRDAQCKYYYVTVRRQALKQLREMVGTTAFYKGELPPHVPIWRIPEID